LYTDITGPADYNLKLSKERAASVRNYLVAKGIASARFHVTGLGIADPKLQMKLLMEEVKTVVLNLLLQQTIKCVQKLEAGN
jgi:hypothetical protein